MQSCTEKFSVNKKRFQILFPVDAAENLEDEWDLAWYLQGGIHISIPTGTHKIQQQPQKHPV